MSKVRNHPVVKWDNLFSTDWAGELASWRMEACFLVVSTLLALLFLLRLTT